MLPSEKVLAQASNLLYFPNLQVQVTGERRYTQASAQLISGRWVHFGMPGPIWNCSYPSMFLMDEHDCAD